MDHSQREKDSPETDSLGSRHYVLKAIFFTGAVFFIFNLNAIVDALLHPEIEYFDDEHLIVGGLGALIMAILLGAIAIYADRQEKLAWRNELARRQALESEKRYRAIFEESSDVLFVTSPEGFFEEINPAGVELFGYNSREEMLHIKTSDLYEASEEQNALKVEVARDGQIRDRVTHMRRKDGAPLTVSITAEAVRDQNGDIVAYRGSLHDVTLQKRMESQLIQTQKMESVGRLASGVAHDFNNYLTTIRGHTELALASVPEDSQVRGSLEEVQRAADAAADLTAQLLLFGSHHAVEMGPVDLNRNIRSLVPMIQRLVNDDVRIREDLAADLHQTVGDAAGINQVVVNLALNANADLPHGGDITVTSCNNFVSNEYVEGHASARVGEFATVSISDTGSGMSGVELAHVFEPLHRGGPAEDEFGLALVYAIVLQHDGWIDVESIPGMGTTFTVFLPARLEREEAVAAASDPLEAADAGRGEHILLVEDDDSVRAITEKILRQNGYVVTGAHNAAEAFARFAGEKGEFQLVFSDVVLPGEDGVSLVDNLRSHKPELAVLLASGYADTAVDWDRLQSSGYRFLQKPYVMPELLKTVRELLTNTS